MTSNLNPSSKSATAKKPLPTVSGVFDNGIILEMVYRPHERQTAFIVWQHDRWTLEQRFSPDPTHCLIPYSPTNNLLQHQVVLLPSEPEEYDSEEALVSEVRAFIHRYVDVSPLFEQVASYYVTKLVRFGRVDARPEGRTRRLFPAPSRA